MSTWDDLYGHKQQEERARAAASDKEALTPDLLHTIFHQLPPQDVEQFYKNYQLWSLQQLRKELVEQVGTLRRKISENSEQMKRVEPSPLALASLAQLQSCGVQNTDLLDTMLERGDSWLDHTMQLLERCERLDLIGGDYTEWCQHALEGAYNWLDSMNENGASAVEATEERTTGVVEDEPELSQVTEELLLRKLMSEDGEDEETSKIPVLRPAARTTQPLPPPEEPAQSEEAVPVVDQPDAIEEPVQDPALKSAEILAEQLMVGKEHAALSAEDEAPTEQISATIPERDESDAAVPAELPASSGDDDQPETVEIVTVPTEDKVEEEEQQECAEEENVDQVTGPESSEPDVDSTREIEPAEVVENVNVASAEVAEPAEVAESDAITERVESVAIRTTGEENVEAVLPSEEPVAAVHIDDKPVEDEEKETEAQPVEQQGAIVVEAASLEELVDQVGEHIGTSPDGEYIEEDSSSVERLEMVEPVEESEEAVQEGEAVVSDEPEPADMETSVEENQSGQEEAEDETPHEEADQTELTTEVEGEAEHVEEGEAQEEKEPDLVEPEQPDLVAKPAGEAALLDEKKKETSPQETEREPSPLGAKEEAGAQEAVGMENEPNPLKEEGEKSAQEQTQTEEQSAFRAEKKAEEDAQNKVKTDRKEEEKKPQREPERKRGFFQRLLTIFRRRQ